MQTTTRTFNSKLECVEINLTVVGKRDPSVVRGKKISISNGAYGTVMDALDHKLSVYNRGESPKADVNQINMANFMEVDVDNTGQAVGMANGWDTSRYMVSLVFRSQVTSQVTEWILVQGFTEHYDILKMRGASDVILDPNGIIEMNKISHYKQMDGGVLTPTTSHNLVLDRWENQEGLVLSSPNTLLSKVDLDRSKIGDKNYDEHNIMADGRFAIDHNVLSVKTSNGDGSNFANSLVNSLLDCSVESLVGNNGQDATKMAMIYTAPNSIHGSPITEELIRFYYDDIAMSVNPHQLTFDYLMATTPDIQTRIFVNGDINNTTDGYYVVDAGNARQVTCGDSILEAKLSAQISEAVGYTMINNDMRSISMTIYRDVTGPEVHGNLNGMVEMSIMGTGYMYEMMAAQNTLRKVKEQVGRLLKRYRFYSVKIEIFNMINCNVTMKIDMDEAITSVHSLFCDATYTNGVSTRRQFIDSSRQTGDLASKISRDTVMMKQRYVEQGYATRTLGGTRRDEFAPIPQPVHTNVGGHDVSSTGIIF